YTLEDLPHFLSGRCEECGIPVRARRDQRIHAIKHLPNQPKYDALKNPYPCPICHTRFGQKNTMIAHLNAKHLHIKPHACLIDDCDKRFACLAGLSHHRERMHQVYPRKRRGPRAKPYASQSPPKAQTPAHSA
ncbi:hypothetical protein HDZ31DRAFT_25398, partial [Schizophyllum fasciatum]